MKKSKKNYVILVMLLLVALAVGYAAFSTNLVINGTATGTATWDVKFNSATMSDANHGTATVAGDGLSVTVASTLGFPGDACSVTANIKNNGTLPAKLTAFELTNAEGTAFTNADVEVLVPTINTDGSETIAAGATCPVTFTIKWKTDSVATTASANFKINFTYEQDTTEVTNLTPSHGAHTPGA